MSFKHSAILVFTLLSLCACTAPSKVMVTNLSDAGSSKSCSRLYALPLTVLDISVKAEKVSFVPGPFGSFAEKYLGILVNTESFVQWHIREIKLTSHAEADPDYILCCKGHNHEAESLLNQLTADKLVLDPKDFASSFQIFQNRIADRDPYPIFADLSVKRNFNVEKDVEISKFMPGILPDDMNDYLQEGKFKTPEQKAEEAANFIFKLRKRRFKLVSGEVEPMPSGNALQDALLELARLEKTYLELFTGRTAVDTLVAHYTYQPVPDKESDISVLFRFSNTKGFLQPKESDGIPIVITLRSKNLTQALDQFTMPLRAIENQIYYRIPEQVDIRIDAGENTLTMGHLHVFQCGALIVISVDKK